VPSANRHVCGGCESDSNAPPLRIRCLPILSSRASTPCRGNTDHHDTLAHRVALIWVNGCVDGWVWRLTRKSDPAVTGSQHDEAHHAPWYPRSWCAHNTCVNTCGIMVTALFCMVDGSPFKNGARQRAVRTRAHAACSSQQAAAAATFYRPLHEREVTRDLIDLALGRRPYRQHRLRARRNLGAACVMDNVRHQPRLRRLGSQRVLRAGSR
jgi:hypothetical protein